MNGRLQECSRCKKLITYPQKPPPPLPRGHHVKPKVWYGSGGLQYQVHPGYGFMLQCETWAPEAWIGRQTQLLISGAFDECAQEVCNPVA
jgi:hypothetical protein